MMMIRTRSRPIETNAGSTYWNCIQLYYGENGSPANYTTTTTVTTTTVTRNPVSDDDLPSTDSLEDKADRGIIIISSSVATAVVVLLFVIVICCLVASRRTERLKRKRTEAEYRVIATTLTSISTDVTDGTTYEELSSMSDPQYIDNVDIQLPSRKQRQRLGGVSNGLAKTMKRWFSVDGEEPTKHNTDINGAVTMGRPPLPSIPETRVSGLFRSKSDKRVSVHNGEYAEIGADYLRRSNVYNPLDGGSGSSKNDPYDKLRKSTLLVDDVTEEDYPGLKKDVPLPDNRASNAYFILEKEEKNSVPATEPGDNYFILEKTAKKDLNEEPSEKKKEQDISEIKTSEVDDQNPEKSTSTNDNVTPIMKNKEDYFILDPESKRRKSSSGEEYLEPTDKQRHSYIQVLPEHMDICKQLNTKL